jgi:predicted ATPase
MAISSGGAIVTRVGKAGAQRVEAVLGEDASLAERLLDPTGTEAVRVAAQTYRLVAPLFEWQAPEDPEAPAAVYCPLARRPEVGKGRGIAGLTSSLVGREHELHALRRALERLQAGSGGIVTVVGEAGLGKSRLVAEARKQTLAKVADPSQGWELQWVEGRCLSYGGSVAYLPWMAVVREVMGLATDAAPTEMRRALQERVRALCGVRAEEVTPYLGRLLSCPLEEEAKARLRGLDAEGVRVLTFRAVETLLEHAARLRPLVLVCEDLHWADPTSLALLEQALALTDQAPVLLICVLRPETGHGCWRIREVAARDYRHRHADLWLEPLSEDESAQLVRELLVAEALHPERVEGLPQALRERIVRYTAGNPLYLEEVLRALIADGSIAHDKEAGRWQAVRDVAALSMPDTLNGVLMARIDRLPRASRQVLQLAAVVGHVAAYRVLAKVVPEWEDLDHQLVVLQRAQMIREQAQVPELTFVFHHQLTMEAAYSSLLQRKRRALHRRVAETLERLYGDRIEEQLGRLAHHWEQAGEMERAVHYLQRAGEQAAAHYANDEAVTCFSRGLTLVPEADLSVRYALFSAREAIYDLQGDREAQYHDLTALRELADKLADARRQADVALRQANYHLRVGDYQAGAADAQRAVSAAQAGAEAAIEAAAYREWGRALFYQTDYEAARLQVERALAMARELGLSRVQADSLHTLGAISDDLGAYVDAQVYFGEELAVCQEMGDRRGEGVALRDLGLASVYIGDRERAETCLHQSLHICRQVGNRRDEAWALVGLGDASSFYGDYPRAKAYHREAVALCRETRARLGETRSLINLGQVSWALGAYREALGYLEQSRRVASDVGYLGIQGWALLSVGGVYAELGKFVKARECLERSLHIAREWGNPRAEGYTLPHLALVFHYLGDDQVAWQHAQAALHLQPHFVGLFIAGYALTALGHVLTDLSYFDEAVDVYSQALQLRRRINQRHLIVAPLAGLLRVATQQRDWFQAATLVEEVLTELDARPMPEGTTEPFRTHLSAYRALSASDDPRGQQVLHRAHHLLCERAAQIEDEELRRSFLENVPAHREIVAEYRQHAS